MCDVYPSDLQFQEHCSKRSQQVLSLYLMISSFQTTGLVALLSFTENLAQMIFV
jgi:hypothetical protein